MPDASSREDALLDSHSPFISFRFERALRFAAVAHRDQVRRTSGVPYIEHVVAVAWILERAGFDEEVVIGGLLHDLLEDTTVTREEIEHDFGVAVRELVTECSEVKTDALGNKRPWLDRKSDHLAALRTAPASARAIVLADKLHNLMSIDVDLREGRPVWDEFHAEREQILWYYRSTISVCTTDCEDPRLQQIATACRELVARITTFQP